MSPLRYIFSLIIILIFMLCVCIHYQCRTKNEFIKGMWYNEQKGIYLYISDKKKKNGRTGAYIIKNDDNEPFEMDININSMCNTAYLVIYGTKYLKKNTKAVMDIAKGSLVIDMKDEPRVTLYKDNYLSI